MIDTGINSNDDAKIGGITPGTLIFNGRNDWSPPNTLLPCWRFGYWTTILRTERSMNTIKAITAAAITNRPTIRMADSAPVRPNSKVPAKALGNSATMPAKIINEIPLPTPRLVICSPSHIRNNVPPTRVATVVIRKKEPGSATTPEAASKPTAMP